MTPITSQCHQSIGGILVESRQSAVAVDSLSQQVLLDQDFIDIFAIDPRVAFGRADDAEVLKADKAMEG